MKKLFNILSTLLFFGLAQQSALASNLSSQVEVERVASEEVSLNGGLRPAGGSISVNFGNQKINLPSSATYNIRNKGPGPLTFDRLVLYGGIDFDAVTNCTPSIEEGKSCSLRIWFTPMFEGFRTGDLYLDFKEDSLHFSLWGWGVR